MPEAEVNGTKLYYELHGGGEPLALVHGGWVDATVWAFVVPGLAQSFRVLIYDCRGHSRSERPGGTADENADDLAALLEALDFLPAHVVTSSSGGSIALRLAARRPGVFRSLTCHEPPLVGLLADDPEGQEVVQQSTDTLEGVARQIADDEHESAARQFVEEIAFGPGAWENLLPPEARTTFVRNAPTFLEELEDRDGLINIEEELLAGLEIPVHLTTGSESPPMYSRVIDRLEELIPDVGRETIEGAAHVPQLTTPERYIEVTTRRLQQHATAG
jgi:pimeloyl-ACP methyl ester carboxylesterase